MLFDEDGLDANSYITAFVLMLPLSFKYNPLQSFFRGDGQDANSYIIALALMLLFEF